jgi:ABC-type sugar transport system ATPase subunit
MPAVAAGEIDLLKVEKLSVRSPRGKTLVQELSFTLKRGEIVGIAGLLGAGRSETFEALFGVLNAAGPRAKGFQVTGNAWIKGRRKDLDTPREAIGARMAFVSEDRKGSGLVLNQSIRANMMLPALVSGRKGLTSARLGP